MKVKGIEALRALVDGKKLRRSSFSEDIWITKIDGTEEVMVVERSKNGLIKSQGLLLIFLQGDYEIVEDQ